MDWLAPLLTPEIISVLVPITGIIGVFSFLGAKAYFRHAERMEKIRNGIDPDADSGDY